LSDSDTRAGLSELQACIGHRFEDISLLVCALTHRSASQIHMERLEFFGDSVLSMAISEYLFRQFPDADEGQLSRWRAYLVCSASLKRVALFWHLHNHVCVGGGERDGKGNIRSVSIVGNSVEATIGAVFIDGGWRAATEVVQAAWSALLRELPSGDMRDSKTRLQEFTQSQGWNLPDYHSTDRGAGMTPRFTVCCFVQGELVGKGVGNRKKEAETAAAEQAWEQLEK